MNKFRISLLLFVCFFTFSLNAFYQETDSELIINIDDDFKFEDFAFFTEDGELSIEIPIAYHSELINFKIEGSINPNNVITKYIGMRSGVFVHILTFDKKATDFKIVIPYQNYSNQKKIVGEDNFVINKKYFNYLKSKIKSEHKFLSSNDWFDPNVTYYRIYTKERKLHKVTYEQIADNNFRNKDLRYFHLLKNGVEVPIKIFDNNNDNQFNQGDELVFLGDFARGDTTYYNFYSEYQAFYFYFDVSSQGLRYDDVNQNSSYSATNSYQINQHIEKQLIYNWSGRGIDYDTRTVPYEELYWSILIGDEERPSTSVMEDYVFIPRSAGDFKIDFRYVNLNDSLDGYFDSELGIVVDLPPTCNVDYFLNGELKGNIFTKEKTDIFRSMQINANRQISGFNQIKFASKKIPNDLGIEARFQSGLDYIKLVGEVEPYSLDNLSEFFYSGTIQSPSWKIPGFSVPEIFYVDEVSNQFGRSLGERGFYINGGYDIRENSFLSLSVDDYNHFHSGNGITIVKHNNGSYESKTFETMNSEVTSFANSRNNNYPLFVAVSGIDRTNELTQFISSLNGDLSGYSQGRAYVMIRNGSNVENYVDNDGVISFSKFVSNDFGTSFINEIKLQNSNGLDVIASELINVNSNLIRKSSNISLKDNSQSAESILLTTDKLYDVVKNEYQAYRSNSMNYKFNTFSIEDVYDQFGNGIREPKSIKAFLNYAYYQWEENNPEYLFLIGESYFYFERAESHINPIDQIPTWGFPYSDYYYGCVDSEEDIISEIKVGRFTADSEDDVINYLNKIREYESAEPAKWMKNFLYLSGGLDEAEISRFYNARVTLFRDYLAVPPLSFDTTAIKKTNLKPGSEENATEIIREINNGTQWVTFLGHAYAEGFDMDGWGANRLSNKGQYPILTTLSCNTGDFANARVKITRNESYVLAKDRGFVAALGSSTSGLWTVQNWFFQDMLKAITSEENNYRRISDFLYFSKDKFAKTITGSWYYYTAFQFGMLGDPMLSIKPAKNVELYLDDDDITVENEKGISTFLANDQIVKIDGFVRNLGICNDNEFSISATKRYGQNDEVQTQRFGVVCNNDEFSFEFDINGMPGTHQITLVVDPDLETTDEDRTNNTFTINIEVFTEGLVNLDPLKFWNLKDDKFRFYNPLGSHFDYNYFFQIKDLDGNLIKESNQSEIVILNSHVDWNPENLNLQGNSYYQLLSRVSNVNNPDEISDWATTEFNTFQSDSDKVNFKIDSKEISNLFELTNFEFDFENQKLKNESHDFMYSLAGSRANPDANPSTVDWAFFEFDNSVYADNRFLPGFHILKVPIDIEDSNIIYKRYDIYDYSLASIDSLSSYSYYKNSDANKMIDFLRDSVSKDDYLMLVTSGSSFRQFAAAELMLPDSDLYTLDTLKKVLNEFGSVLIDSISGPMDIWSLAWDWKIAMVGRKGAEKGSIEELISDKKDTVSLSGNIRRYYKNGNLLSSTIGIASEWEKLNLKAVNDEEVILSYQILNRDNQIIYQSENLENFDLSQIDAKENPEIKLSLEYEISDFRGTGTDISTNLSIESVEILFKPTPELYIDDSMLSITTNVLKGTEIDLNYSANNISLRKEAERVPVDIIVRRENGTRVNLTDTLEVIQANSSIEKTFSFGSEFLDYNNNVTVELDKDNFFNERLKFNNTAAVNLTLIRDTIKPVIEVYFDDKPFINNMWIANQPQIRIDLYDNSPLNLYDQNNLNARFNGYFQPGTATQEFEYEFFDAGENELKMTFAFLPEETEFEDVLLQVYAMDSEGNRDTLRYDLKSSLRGSNIQDLMLYPHPVIEEANFKFNFISQNNGGEVVIEIYDITGRKIKTIKQDDLTVGEFSISWDGKDDYNSEINPGVYFYKLEVKGDFFVEPEFGKIMISR